VVEDVPERVRLDRREQPLGSAITLSSTLVLWITRPKMNRTRSANGNSARNRL
jgi:hypothetical protein